MHLLKSGKTRVPFVLLNRLMNNVESEQFSYEVFKAAFDQDPAIQKMVKDFDEQGIVLGTERDIKTDKKSGGDSVSTMAKRATNLSDL